MTDRPDRSSGSALAAAAAGFALVLAAACTSTATIGLSPGVDASPPADGSRIEPNALPNDGGPATCGSPLNGLGCPCAPGSPPRQCYIGEGEPGVGTCHWGTQSCVSRGESGGSWGACTGYGARSATCASAGAQCGIVPDGCGGSTPSCGACPAGQHCGGGGPGLCGTMTCVPTKTCKTLGAVCGPIIDDCGETVDCGTCPGHQLCAGGNVLNQCGCTASTCAQLGAQCGTAHDTCGNALSCGSCSAGESCGASGTANQCGPCVPVVTCKQPSGSSCLVEVDSCNGPVMCSCDDGGSPDADSGCASLDDDTDLTKSQSSDCTLCEGSSCCAEITEMAISAEFLSWQNCVHDTNCTSFGQSNCPTDPLPEGGCGEPADSGAEGQCCEDNFPNGSALAQAWNDCVTANCGNECPNFTAQVHRPRRSP